MSIQNIPIIGRLLETPEQKKERDKEEYRRRGLSPQRAEERPFEGWSDKRLKRDYVDLVVRIRQADSGFGLSPLVDRSALMADELRERGIYDETPDADQFERIVAELEARAG